jgi:colicin import membrane protein
MSFVRQHSGAVVWSVALHVAVAAALMLNVGFPSRARVAMPTQLVIEAVVVDQAALNAEVEKREQAVREAERQRQREERQAREAVEREQRERAAAEQREQERIVELRRQEQRAEQEARAKAEAEARAKVEAEARERADAEKREQERLAAERRQREEREREEAAKREREAAARRQAQREAELAAAAQAEEARQRAEQAGLLDQYSRLLQNHIERNWIPPPSARPGINCEINVVQIPSGDVVDARVGQCNGDEAVIRSIEAAVRRASPLPKPPHPSLFERNLRLIFRPDLQ